MQYIHARFRVAGHQRHDSRSASMRTNLPAFYLPALYTCKPEYGKTYKANSIVMVVMEIQRETSKKCFFFSGRSQDVLQLVELLSPDLTPALAREASRDHMLV
jgi:hypothetical protein